VRRVCPAADAVIAAVTVDVHVRVKKNRSARLEKTDGFILGRRLGRAVAALRAKPGPAVVHVFAIGPDHAIGRNGFLTVCPVKQFFGVNISFNGCSPAMNCRYQGDKACSMTHTTLLFFHRRQNKFQAISAFARPGQQWRAAIAGNGFVTAIFPTYPLI
jgi:hypothetical protein